MTSFRFGDINQLFFVDWNQNGIRHNIINFDIGISDTTEAYNLCSRYEKYVTSLKLTKFNVIIYNISSHMTLYSLARLAEYN